MNQIQRINARGHANGWHADMLQAQAAREGRTMAEAFVDSVRRTYAFNVPGTATAVLRHANQYRPTMLAYKFADDSQVICAGTFVTVRRGALWDFSLC